MSYLLLDAAFLACPRPMDMPQEERHTRVREYLLRLVELSSLRRTCRSTEFVRDSQLTLVLHELGSYPIRPSIIEALSLCSDEFEIQVEDANRLVYFLLERSALLEDMGGFIDVVVGEFSVVPEFDPAPPEKFLKQLIRTAALAALAIPAESTFLATSLVPQSQPNLSFNMTLTLVEKDDGSILEPTEPVSISLPIHKNTASYLKALNLSYLLGQENADALIDCCIAFAVRDEATPAERAAQLSGLISVGDDFVRTASRLGFLHEPSKMQRLIRACADILVGRNLAKSHHLRSGKGGNDAQRMSGNWGAWRHDLDDEFHLHYWRDGSVVKFANVVVHNDFDITY